MPGKIDRLYKYSSKKWCDLFLSRGSIRIGTLHDYRKKEHSPGIHDAHEGLKTITHRIDDWDLSKSDASTAYHEAASSTLGLIRKSETSGDLPFRISGMSFRQEYDDPDCFVHCTSYKLSKTVMQEFQGADSCFEIYKFEDFYKHLTDSINEIIPIKLCELRVVKYASRDEIFNGSDLGIPPTRIKGVEFSKQFEVRAIWHPKEKCAIEPLEFEDIRLARYGQKVKVR